MGPRPAPSNCARHAERAGLHRAGERDVRPGSRTTTRSAPARRSTTRAPARAPARRRSSPAGRLRRLGLGAEAGRPAEGERALRLRYAGNLAIHLPMVVGPIAVVYNVSGQRTCSSSRPPRRHLLRQDHHLEQPGDRRRQPGRDAAEHQDHAVHRADSSGTSDNFTKYLPRPLGPPGRTTTTRSGTPRAATLSRARTVFRSSVASTNGAIGYVEWSFATLNNLNIAKIFNGAGEWST